MAACIRVLVSLSQAEVDHVNDMLLLAYTDQEVIRFYVAMEEALLVHILDSLQHLNAYHKHSLK